MAWQARIGSGSPGASQVWCNWGLLIGVGVAGVGFWDSGGRFGLFFFWSWRGTVKENERERVSEENEAEPNKRARRVKKNDTASDHRGSMGSPFSVVIYERKLNPKVPGRKVMRFCCALWQFFLASWGALKHGMMMGVFFALHENRWKQGHIMIHLCF